MDFGTTYTSCFYWNGKDYKKLFGEYQDPFEPTLSVFDGVNWEYGSTAKVQLPNSSIKQLCKFVNFKMLLGGIENEVLGSLGYDKYTPREITKRYLTFILEEVLDHCPDNKIDKLVVGIPELWLDAKQTIAAKDCLERILTEIKKEIKDKGTITEIITESEATLACAYFAYEYRRRINADFNGNMLVIDYGGGTLDINFCEITQGSDAKNKKQTCEINPTKRAGNAKIDSGKHIIGKAGVGYIQSVVNKIVGNETIENHKRYKLEQDLENALQKKQSKIKNEFKQWHGAVPDELRNGVFLPGFYDNQPITYGDLWDVFEEYIISRNDNDGLEAILNEIDRIAQLNDKEYKIALTGGFCNFYLTERAVYAHYNIKTNKDIKVKDMNMDDDGRAYAIAKGAALVAADEVLIKPTYRYSLGVIKKDRSVYYLAFICGEEICDQPKYVREPGCDKNEVFVAGKIPLLYFDSDGKGKFTAQAPDKNYMDKFEMPGDPMKDRFIIGFSLDKKKTLKLHLQKVKQDSVNWIVDGNAIVHDLPTLVELLYDPNDLVSVGKMQGRI